MDRDKNITSRFVLRDYPLTINQAEEGKIKEELIQQKNDRISLLNIAKHFKIQQVVLHRHYRLEDELPVIHEIEVEL